LSKSVEEQISRELLLERSLVENRQLPISSYNYSAVRDRLLRRGIEVSLTTIIERAKVLGCHRPRPKKKAHEREVITAAIGALIQHDASHHLWSPYAKENGHSSVPLMITAVRSSLLTSLRKRLPGLISRPQKLSYAGMVSLYATMLTPYVSFASYVTVIASGTELSLKRTRLHHNGNRFLQLSMWT